jgi:hypothetical protein
MIVDKKGSKGKNEPTPKDAQKGGQGAVGNEDRGAELDQRRHPGASSKKLIALGKRPFLSNK